MNTQILFCPLKLLEFNALKHHKYKNSSPKYFGFGEEFSIKISTCKQLAFKWLKTSQGISFWNETLNCRRLILQV
jgi:hypothetical protein